MPRRRARTLVAVALGLVLAAFTAASPATAHDELVSSTPASDSALDPAPTEVVLTYSDNILDVGVEVTVTDAGGTDWVSGAPVVDGPDVTTPLESDLPRGAYTVNWRVVSSDGHPISGTLPFSVTTPEATTTPSAPASEPAAVTTPTDSVTSAPSSAAESDASQAEPGLSGAHVAIIAGIALAALVVVVVVLLLVARRRNPVTDAESDAAGPRGDRP
jgi:methionine-rich copper-binding protein CopC